MSSTSALEAIVRDKISDINDDKVMEVLERFKELGVTSVGDLKHARLESLYPKPLTEVQARKLLHDFPDGEGDFEDDDFLSVGKMSRHEYEAERRELWDRTRKLTRPQDTAVLAGGESISTSNPIAKYFPNLKNWIPEINANGIPSTLRSAIYNNKGVIAASGATVVAVGLPVLAVSSLGLTYLSAVSLAGIACSGLAASSASATVAVAETVARKITSTSGADGEANIEKKKKQEDFVTVSVDGKETGEISNEDIVDDRNRNFARIQKQLQESDAASARVHCQAGQQVDEEDRSYVVSCSSYASGIGAGLGTIGGPLGMIAGTFVGATLGGGVASASKVRTRESRLEQKKKELIKEYADKQLQH